MRAGVFKDVDVVLYNHVGSNLATRWGDGGGNGLISVEYTFEGETAHSAGAPWRGRSALDAVELMNVGWNYRREHLRLQQRSHYVITDGGDQPNVVPRTASVWYYFRELDFDAIKNLWAIGDKMAEGATLMTNTKFSSRVLGSAWPSHMNRPLAESMQTNIKAVGPADVDGGRRHAGEGDAEGARRAGRRPDDGDSRADGEGVDSGRGEARRRIGRHRRHLVDACRPCR